MRQSYWIEIVTPKGKIELWSYGAPIRQFVIARELGYPVAYGREGLKPSRQWPKSHNFDTQPEVGVLY